MLLATHNHIAKSFACLYLHYYGACREEGRLTRGRVGASALEKALQSAMLPAILSKSTTIMPIKIWMLKCQKIGVLLSTTDGLHPAACTCCA